MTTTLHLLRFAVDVAGLIAIVLAIAALWSFRAMRLDYLERDRRERELEDR